MDQNQVDAIEATRFLKKLQAANVLGRLENLEKTLYNKSGADPVAKEPEPIAPEPVEPTVDAPVEPVLETPPAQ